MSWSTARTQSTSTPSFCIASATTAASASVLDGCGDGFSVQLMTRLLSFAPQTLLVSRAPIARR